ncbi:MAG: ParB N-terminal domain-containing protein [Acidilobus sp.]
MKPHEMFLEDRVAELVTSIRVKGALLRPLVVEASSLILLDGAHRLKALRELGALSAPVALVRYDRVGLKGWVRMYPKESLRDLRRVAEVSDVRELTGGPTIVTLGGGSEAYYDLVQLESLGHRLLKVVTRSSIRNLGSYLVLVIPPPPTKELVIKAALTGRLLPPRSTRHVTEAKKVRLRTPLASLMSHG